MAICWQVIGKVPVFLHRWVCHFFKTEQLMNPSPWIKTSCGRYLIFMIVKYSIKANSDLLLTGSTTLSRKNNPTVRRSI